MTDIDLELNEKAWDEIGEKATPPSMNEGKFKEMLDLFCEKLPDNAKVLDLGCGPGLPKTKYLVDKGLKVTAIDISAKMVELAKKNVPEATYSKMSMTDIDFEDEFDGILSSYTMLCLDVPNFKKTAAKIARALKKNGLFLLVLNEPGPEGHDESKDVTEIMGQKLFSRPYTEEEIRNIFSEHGMKLLKVERETLNSEEYGEEHELIVLLEKE